MTILKPSRTMRFRSRDLEEVVGKGREWCVRRIAEERETDGAFVEENVAFLTAAIAQMPALALETTDAGLKAYAANVRRTGLTLGRDGDLVAAVKAGHLSVSDAMNSDD